MEQELAASFGIVGPETGGVFVGRDVDTEEPGLAVLHPGVGVGQGDPAGPERLHLGALEGDTAFVGLQDVVVVTGPAVAGHGPDAVGLGAGRRRLVPTTTWSFGGGHGVEGTWWPAAAR